MNCEKYLDLISARLDGELTQQEETELTAHLQSCPACRAIAEDLQGLRAALGNVGEVEAPTELSKNVMAQIAKEKQRTRRRFVRQLTGLAACLVLCVGLYQLTRPESPATADPNLPGLARHMDSQMLDQAQAQTYAVSNEQHLRLSDMGASVETEACLLDGTDELTQMLARFPDSDLTAQTSAYDEEYFQTRCLLAVVVQEPSSSITHAITAVEENKVTLLRRVPQAGNCDMALWLILAEVDAQAGPARNLDVEWINE